MHFLPYPMVVRVQIWFVVKFKDRVNYAVDVAEAENRVHEAALL